MNIAFALLILAATGRSSLHPRLPRHEDENGSDDRGSGSDEDESSTLSITPSVTPLTPLRFSFLTTTDGGNGGLRYSETSIPALELAVQHINENYSILPRFNLSYELHQLECSTEDGLDAFFNGVFSRGSILTFLGSACPQAVQPIAELVHRWNISEILASPLEIGSSNEGVAPTPNLLRLYPQESLLVPALLSLTLQSQWKRILILSGVESNFQEVFKILTRSFQQHNITVAHRELESPITSVSNHVGETDDYRIVFLNMNPASARIVLCEAYHRGKRYPFNTWILYGWYESGWWKDVHQIDSESLSCSDDQISSVLLYSFALRVYPKPSEKDAISDTGISYNQFCEQHSELMRETRRDQRVEDSTSFLAPLTYDAVWTLALALHRVDSLSHVQTDSDAIPDSCGATASSINDLGDFNYSNFHLGCRIKHELLETNFVGISGEVRFTEGGTRHILNVTLLQYRTSDNSDEVSEVEIAEYDLENGHLSYCPGESNATVFPNGVTPDGTPRNVTVTYYLALTVTYYTIATIGIIFTFVCLIFNVKYRNTRVVKLTSPSINYFLIVGALMMFLSIYIRILPHTGQMVNNYRCNIQAWVNTIAYCFGYGTILTKMGRVYKIFHNPSAKKNQIGVKDWHMVMIVALITGVGVLLLTIMTAVLRPNLALLPSEEYESGKDELGITINYYAWQCYGGENKAPFYYLLFIFSYLGLLQLIGLVLAIRTRKVKISILNDSKYITAIVYVSSLVVVVMMLVTFVSGNLQNLNEAFFSAGLLLSTYIFLGLTFIPKMISYYRDPHGNKMMKDLTGAHSVKLQKSGFVQSGTAEQEKIASLEQRVAELEGELKRYKTTNVHVVQECYSNAEEEIPSPTTTFSHTSSGSFSQAGSFGHTGNRLFLQHSSSVENNGVVFGGERQGGISRPVSTFVEHKTSPLVQTAVSFPSSRQHPVTQSPDSEVSQAALFSSNCEECPPITSSGGKQQQTLLDGSTVCIDVVNQVCQ